MTVNYQRETQDLPMPAEPISLISPNRRVKGTLHFGENDLGKGPFGYLHDLCVQPNGAITEQDFVDFMVQAYTISAQRGMYKIVCPVLKSDNHALHLMYTKQHDIKKIIGVGFKRTGAFISQEFYVNGQSVPHTKFTVTTDDKVPVARARNYSLIDGRCFMEDVFTVPEKRHLHEINVDGVSYNDGLGTLVVRDLLSFSRANGASGVVACCDDTGWLPGWYIGKLGFNIVGDEFKAYIRNEQKDSGSTNDSRSTN